MKTKEIHLGRRSGILALPALGDRIDHGQPQLSITPELAVYCVTEEELGVTVIVVGTGPGAKEAIIPPLAFTIAVVDAAAESPMISEPPPNISPQPWKTCCESGTAVREMVVPGGTWRVVLRPLCTVPAVPVNEYDTEPPMPEDRTIT